MRLFDGPWMWILVFIVVVAAVVWVLVGSANRSKRSDLTALAPTGYGPTSGLGGNYVRGMNHRTTATTFGVLGLFVLGIVFGPLALVQAHKAEVLGVKATTGKVLGWISVAMGFIWLAVIVPAMTR